MKVIQINTSCGVGSTGKIAVGISKVIDAGGIENYILYSSRTNGYIQGIGCSDNRYIKQQALLSRFWGNYGFNSAKATKRMINILEKIKPDIVHLHNIHGHDCDIKRLFTYFKERKIKVVWTFHDCWAFTGYCTHFTLAMCDKWRTCCSHCVQKKGHSWFFDKSQWLFEQKKKLFGETDMIIVTPSRWLADLVKQSFLKDCTVEVINNGIDLDIFKPCESEFRQKYGLEGKKVLLGVSFGWNYQKGLDVFVKLAERLPDEYKIVLIGTDKKIDTRLPEKIISIHRTHNQRELAEIYTAADLFISPSREENYPTVHMEAIACGTPVVTFQTGGAPEIVDDTCGSVVECDDVDSLEKEIIRICTDKPYTKDMCLKRAKNFDENEKFKEYLNLYERIIT